MSEKNIKTMKKAELVNILVEDYGYDESDLKDDEGKVYTNAKLRSIILQEIEDEDSFNASEGVIIAKVSPIGDNDLIVVMNGLSGALTHRSTSTNRVWKFRSFGQTDKIPYSEILSIRNNNPKVFDEGWLIVLNEQVQDELGVKEMYKNILTPDNIEKVFDKSVNDLSNFIDNLPDGMKVTFFHKARELYGQGKIDSKAMIDLIEEKFDISLEDNAPLSDIV